MTQHRFGRIAFRLMFHLNATRFLKNLRRMLWGRALNGVKVYFTCPDSHVNTRSKNGLLKDLYYSYKNDSYFICISGDI